MEEPKTYDFNEAEPRWQKYWEKEGIYKFNPEDKKEIYSIDTPPPTVSGKMHIGHACSYSQQDFVARFKRMNGYSVFYPFGTDDNGLATERLVEKENKVRSKDMTRPEFIKLCLSYLDKIRPDFIGDWKRIAVSSDFGIFYSTINDYSRAISQRSFIDLYNMGREYRKQAPALWCPECQTAIGQIECEDKEIDSFFNDIIFKAGKEDLIIATTRPELLPACVAVFFNPDDKRYKKLEGKMAKVPLFDFEVPVLPDKRADPEKGTGLVMCCTFGDQTDIEWQKAHNLPIKTAISGKGLMTELAGKYKDLHIKKAREAIINDLKEAKLLISQKPIKHMVNVHERCKTPIEFVHSKQWFVKYLDLKDDMLKWGAELNWFPEYMKTRYDNWVKGLQWDWCISRQRHFGVPFPVWYCAKCDEVILADKKSLPVDPVTDKCPIKKCPKCGNNEFTPEKDVLDTWATSSLTPQLSTELFKDHKVFKKLFPMSLRPQAHDIITFWLFNTTVKSHLHQNVSPWKDVIISGFVLDSKGRKMAKSLGNGIDPREVVSKFGADALRFWAGESKLGDDINFKEEELQRGKKMITKLWNATKFTLQNLESYKGEKPKSFNLMDRWMLSKLHTTIKAATENFDKYSYSNAKYEAEHFFWTSLCDNYLELVKDRMYNADKRDKNEVLGAKYLLYNSILSVLKMEAPFMPYITEEIYHWRFAKDDNKKSIHISDWPKADEILIDKDALELGDKIIEIIGAARKAKAEKKVSLKTEIEEITIECDAKLRKAIEEAKVDLMPTIYAKKLTFGKASNELSEGLKVDIKLATI